MTSRQHEEESLFGKIARMTAVGVTSAATGSTLAQGLDGAFPDEDAVDVTGLHGAQVDTGSVIHHGPIEGGELLERPTSGYLAHASSTNGVELEQGLDVTTIARDIDKAGTFNIGDQEIAVLDYIPGGDIVQMASGTVNPAQVMMGIAHYGMHQQLQKDKGNDVDIMSADSNVTRDITADRSTSQSSENGFDSSDESSFSSQNGQQQNSDVIGGNSQHIPDAAQRAQDMEALAFQHRMDLDTVVETSDQAEVRTEIHAHGQTLEVTTQFEATAEDNREEREEARDHVMDMAHSPINETESSRPDMRFRSKVIAHLDAIAKDEGMSI